MNALANTIRDEIAASGAISFARFMDLALYCPVYGFYEQERDTVGRKGDYYTSVSVGNLFGELLAHQFAEWFAEVSNGQWPTAKVGGEVGPVQIVEAGAHDGRLAKDVLTWLRVQRPELFEKTQYWIIEPSERRQKWQKGMLSEFAPRVRWLASLESAVTSHFSALIFSNELLDAMPVHRLGWDALNRIWFEWGVTIRDGEFIWARLPGAIPPNAQSLRAKFHLPVAPFDLPPELLEVLPDGFSVEISPPALNWWRQAAETLEHGRLLTIDYGLTADRFFVPERTGGTLRAYHRHRLGDDVLANPGEQDITAHVNFTALQTVGELAGLKTDGFMTQAQFLTRIAERVWKNKDSFGDWTPERVRQFKTLIHPDHLGRSFRVLVQSRGTRWPVPCPFNTSRFNAPAGI